MTVKAEIMAERAAQLLKWGLLSVLVVGILFVGLQWKQRRDERRETAAFGLLQAANEIETQALKAPEVMSKDAVQVLLQAPEATKTAYTDAFKKVIAEYPASKAAAMASMRLGRWQFLNTQYAEAAESYKKVAQDMGSGKDEILYKAIALDGQATSLEEGARDAEALAVFEAAVALNDNPLKPLALLGKARVLGKTGKAPEARAAYEQVVRDFPNTPYEKKARALMDRAG